MKNNFYKKVLNNGFTVILEKRDVPVISASISTRVGGIHEDLGEKGISHFIEHMLYKGTKNRTAREISFDIEKNGGEMNGFTSEEITSFWCKMPSDRVDVALDVLGDLVKNPLFEEEELEKERQVIFEEMKMRRDSPRHYVMDKIQSFLYDGTLGVDLIGDKKTMSGIGREEMVERWKETYVPANLILIVVGNCDFDYLVKWAEDNFGGGEIKGSIKVREFGKKNGVAIEKRRGVDQANLVFAYHSPVANTKGAYVAEVLATLMGGGLSSRLFSEIREKRNLAYSIHADLDANKNYSHSLIYAGVLPENVDKVKNLIIEEYDKVSRDLSEKELDDVKRQIVGNYRISMEDSQVQMTHLLIWEIIGNVEGFYDFEKNILEVGLKDVQDMARWVSDGNYSFFALVPDKEN